MSDLSISSQQRESEEAASSDAVDDDNGLSLACHENIGDAVGGKRSFSAQQLARESGFHSYRTFSDAFKRKTGLSVTAWMKSERERLKLNIESGHADTSESLG